MTIVESTVSEAPAVPATDGPKLLSVSEAYNQAKDQLAASGSPNGSAASPVTAVVAPSPVTEPPIPATEPADEAPTVDEATPADEVSVPPVYADEESLKDQLFKVKVDGDEIEVTYPELRDGYSRTSSYTRRSQALSAREKELAELTSFKERIDAEPLAVASQLADLLDHDLVPRGASPPAPAAVDDLGFETAATATTTTGNSEPAGMAELRAEVEALKAAQAAQGQQRLLQDSLASAKATLDKYEITAVTPAEVVAHQVREDLPSTEVAVKDLAFDTMRERTVEKARLSQNAERAKQASKQVSRTPSAGTGAGRPNPKPIKTVNDALDVAREQLGMSGSLTAALAAE